MSATWPRRWPCSGRSRRRSRPTSTTARLRLSNVVERLASLGRAEAPGALAAMLDHLDAERPLRLAQARDRRACASAFRRGSPRSRWPQAFGLDVDAVEEVWHGIGPPYRADLRLGRGARRAADRRGRAGVPPLHARPSARGSARRRWTIMPPSGNGTGSASSSSMPAARPGSTAAPATTSPAASPTSPRRSRTPGRARRRIAGEGRVPGRRRGGGAASFNALQQRLGRKIVSAKMLGDYPAFVRLYDILFDGAEDLRAAAAGRAPGAARGVRRPARSRALRPLRADRGRRASRRSRRSAPAPATPRSRG